MQQILESRRRSMALIVSRNTLRFESRGIGSIFLSDGHYKVGKLATASCQGSLWIAAERSGFVEIE
jgi:hypothetical protein